MGSVLKDSGRQKDKTLMCVRVGRLAQQQTVLQMVSLTSRGPVGRSWPGDGPPWWGPGARVRAVWRPLEERKL